LWKDLQSGVAANMEEDLKKLVDKAEKQDHRSMASVMQMMFGNSDQSELNVPLRPSTSFSGKPSKKTTKVEYNLKENGPNPNFQSSDFPS